MRSEPDRLGDTPHCYRQLCLSHSTALPQGHAWRCDYHRTARNSATARRNCSPLPPSRTCPLARTGRAPGGTSEPTSREQARTSRGRGGATGDQAAERVGGDDPAGRGVETRQKRDALRTPVATRLRGRLAPNPQLPQPARFFAHRSKPVHVGGWLRTHVRPAGLYAPVAAIPQGRMDDAQGDGPFAVSARAPKALAVYASGEPRGRPGPPWLQVWDEAPAAGRHAAAYVRGRPLPWPRAPSASPAA
jgi:hypothetical protein